LQETGSLAAAAKALGISVRGLHKRLQRVDREWWEGELRDRPRRRRRARERRYARRKRARRLIADLDAGRRMWADLTPGEQARVSAYLAHPEPDHPVPPMGRR